MLIKLRRWLRTTLKRIGIHRPFPGVICVEGMQAIVIDEEWRASITVKRRLVFTEPPSAGDLCDTYALGLNRPIGSVFYTSPDAVELGREQRVPGRLLLYWWPKESPPLYTLHEHEHVWRSTNPFDAPALCLEHACDMRTGVFSLECVAPAPFDAAVVFKRPRWPRRLSERTTIQLALQRLHDGRARALILDDGRRAKCEIRRANVGDRYLFVAFRQCGVADCERWLQETSILGRAQRVLDTWAHALRG
jgi:hypothetical protein